MNVTQLSEVLADLFLVQLVQPVTVHMANSHMVKPHVGHGYFWPSLSECKASNDRVTNYLCTNKDDTHIKTNATKAPYTDMNCFALKLTC